MNLGSLLQSTLTPLLPFLILGSGGIILLVLDAIWPKSKRLDTTILGIPLALLAITAKMGGALAIGVCDRLLMLKYSTYSVISPEGCASILWKDAEKAPLAAEAMAITSDRLHELRLCDRIVPEPLGGAHRDPEKMARLLKGILAEELRRIIEIPIEDVLDQRYHRLMSIGRFDES